MNKTTPILTAVMSKLISERDEVLAQLDLIINKNISDSGLSGIVKEATELFKKLSEVENAIETLKYSIQNNGSTNYSEEVKRLRDTLIKMQEEKQIKNIQDDVNP